MPTSEALRWMLAYKLLFSCYEFLFLIVLISQGETKQNKQLLDMLGIIQQGGTIFPLFLFVTAPVSFNKLLK